MRGLKNNFILNMSEEKNRNYKTINHDASGPESIPSFLSKTYDILEVIFLSIQEPQIQRHYLLD
jgi:hypothetical protein